MAKTARTAATARGGRRSEGRDRAAATASKS